MLFLQCYAGLYPEKAMISTDELQNRLGVVLPFLNREPGLIDEAIHEGRLVTLDRGQYICMEGNLCSALPVLLQGSARIYKMGENGREITLYRLYAGDSCILTASCILNEKDFPAFAVAEEALEAYLIPPGVLQRWVKLHDGWRNYVFDLLANRLHVVIAVVEEVVFRRLDVRLAVYLQEKATGDNKFTINTTHEAVASDLGSSREVVSRLLKEFELEGILSVERGKIRIVGADLLERRAGGVP